LRIGPFGNGLHRICAVAAAPTARELAKLVCLGVRETPTLELRLDWLQSDSERQKFLAWLKRRKWKGITFLATCRRRIGGGELAGDLDAELYWLMKARAAGCQWCDLEVETLRELPEQSVRGFAVPEKVLLSIHDFRRTPATPKLLRLPERGGADAIKLAAMAKTIADSGRLLKAARDSRHVVVVPMGEIGMPARILALREGSALAYAPVATATAPGQVGLRELKDLYRAHELTRKTAVYGVIGNPIAHSLSPLMHNTGYVAAKRDAVFLPFLVERLHDFLEAIPDFGLRGFSVTIPHKESVFRTLDDCEPLAEKIGAVNTVTVRRDGSLYGSNTDYLGVLRALEKKTVLQGGRVLIYGAGGAARAAAFAVATAGAEVFVCARREPAARALARAVRGEAVKRAALRKMKFDVLVNATPVGMHPHPGISPLAPAELNCSLIFDLIYRPLRTELLRMAAEKGMQILSGAEMFIAQGIAQWELWMKQSAPETEMRKAVLAVLQTKEKVNPRV
jgi:3-dehydroquinate dehydratase/shikimate dehydrogenase